jgi:hypothetical protein
MELAMNPAKNHGDWISIPGSRRRTSRTKTEDPVAIDAMTRESQRGNRPRPMELPKVGPVDWIEAIRGILFFGILATVLWLEWVAIKAIATYVSTFV